MFQLNYKLSIGKWSVDSADDPRTEFMDLETLLSLDSTHDVCRTTVYAPPARQAGIKEQLAGEAAKSVVFEGGEEEQPFAVQIRGQAIKPGDKLTIELTSGDRTAKVATAEVQAFESSLGQVTIRGGTGKQKLANARLNQVYENQSLKQIVSDLASQAGVATGDIDTGSTYSCFIVHESKNLLTHLRELAKRDGLDIYFDEENQLTLKKFNKSSADHTFSFGIDVLDLHLRHDQPVSDHLLVYGESPASKLGGDTWYWLAKDPSPFAAEVGNGANTLAIADGALRTKDAAANLAASRFGALKDGATQGKLKILGNPEVKLGDTIEIKKTARPELNGLFKVISVRHVLNKREGYVTFVGFSGQGGSELAGSLLK